mgnify:CR=1 FL=1
MVNGGFLPERQHPRKSNNALLPLKINTFTTIGELIRYLPEEHSIRISEIAQHYSKRAIREEQKSIQKELDRVILEDLKRDFINRAKKKLEPTPEERMKEAWEAHKRLEALFIRNGVIGEKFISDPLALKDWDSLTEEDKALILPVFEGMTEEEIKAYWNDISPINREMIINRK